MRWLSEVSEREGKMTLWAPNGAPGRRANRQVRGRSLRLEWLEQRTLLSIGYQFAVATSPSQVAVFSVAGASISTELRSVSPTSDLAMLTNGAVRGNSYRVDQTASGGYLTYSNYPTRVTSYDSSDNYLGQVTTSINSPYYALDVAGVKDGGFVVIRTNTNNYDDDLYSYNSSGGLRASKLSVSGTLSGITALEDGSLAVLNSPGYGTAWIRIYDPATLTQTGEFDYSGVPSDMGEFDIAGLGNGGVAVFGKRGSEYYVYAWDSPSDTTPTEIKLSDHGVTTSGYHIGGNVFGTAPPLQPGITVAPASGLVTTEAGGTATFTIVLDTEPTANVTIGLSSGDDTEGTVSPASVTFTPANWSTAQTVTVTGVDDASVDGDVDYTIVTAAATSSDSDYAGLDPTDVSVTNFDNDAAEYQFAVATSSGQVAVFTVAGTSITKEFRSVSPASDLAMLANGAVRGSSYRVDQTVSGGYLTYSNYPTNVKSYDSSDNYLGQVTTSINSPYFALDVAGVEDGGFVLIRTNTNNYDDDLYSYNSSGSFRASKINVSGTLSGITALEDGSLAVLNSPAYGTAWIRIYDPVTLTQTGAFDYSGVPSDMGEFDIAGLSNGGVAVFGKRGSEYYVYAWDSPSDTHPTEIRLSDYGITATGYMIGGNVFKDEGAAGITVAPAAGLVTTEAGGTDTFTIVLDTEPTANVTIGLSSSDETEGTVSPTSVTFTPGNWSTPQTVTVSGVDDSLDDDDTDYTIVTAAAVSADTAYDGLDAVDVWVTNVDDDAPTSTTYLWVGVDKSDPYENTAQRFAGPGSPVQVIGNNFNAEGAYWNLAVSGTTLYSCRSTSVHQWDAVTGVEIGPLSLSTSLYGEIGASAYGMGTTTDGDLLFTAFGYSTEQRGLAKYAPDGTHLRTYTHSNLQHVHGTAAGNNDATYVAARYNPGSGWTENVLMWTEAGAYVGILTVPGDVGDVAIMGNQLYVLAYGSGVRVYDLNGTSLPTYSHTISLPATVTPASTWGDDLYAHDGYLYLTEDNDDQCHKIDLSGALLETYDIETRGSYNHTGSMAIVSVALPDMDVQGNGISISDGDATPSAADHTDFEEVDVVGATRTRTFTIENTGLSLLSLAGDTPVTITGPDADDFAVSSQPGLSTLDPGQSTTFDVQFDPSAAGLRTATVNIASDDPDEDPYDYAIQGTGLLPAPVLDPEPTTTPGTENTIYWSPVVGADAYFAEYDDDADFSSPEGNSGWISDTQYTFTGLSDGVDYYYRARARQLIPGTADSWNQTAEAEFAADVLTNTTATASPGDVVLTGGSGGDSLNILVFGPTYVKQDFMDDLASMGHTAALSQTFPADPSVYDVIVAIGRTEAVSSSVWDNYTSSGGGLIIFERAINGSPIAISTSANCNPVSSYKDWILRSGTTVIDSTSPLTAGLSTASTLQGYTLTPTLKSGAQTAIRWTGSSVPMAVTYSYGAGKVVFLNDLWSWYYGTESWRYDHDYGYDLMSNSIDYVGVPSGYASSGSVVSTAITPSPPATWGTLTFNDTTPSGSTLTVDVLPATGSTPISGYANVSSGVDLSGITEASIRLRANLATTDPSVTPALHDWTVDWQATPDLYLESEWSDVESSTQDDTPPAVTLTAPALTNDPTPSLTVTATDANGLPDGTGVLLDVDLNNDGDFDDPGELAYTTSSLVGGSATFDVSPALADGTYPLRARVSDVAGNEGSDVQTMVVLLNQPPVADADGPYVIGEGDDLVLDASGSYDPDAGDSIVSYAWDLDNDGQYDDLVTTDAVAAVPYGTLQTLGLGLGTYPIGLQVTDTHAATGTDATTVEIVIPPSVEGVLVNDGSAQRSMVTSLTVSFDRAIAVEAGAFELVRRDGVTVPVSVALSPDATDAVLSFAGWLEDGVYDLTVRRDYVHDLDGVCLAADHFFTFHRLYADSDGDGDVDGVDLVAFRGTYGLSEGMAGYLWYFDSDGDDDVDYDDYYAFRANYRKLLTY